MSAVVAKAAPQRLTCSERGRVQGEARRPAPLFHQRHAACQRLRRCAAESAAGVAADTAPPPPVAEAAAPATAVVAAKPLPFFPDRRCVEDLQLPPLSACHHYVNLTNGLEALPRLQQLGLPYRFLRLPSTRCEQQQFEALMNDLDADLLMRLALGQCCLVYDFGSRNKKRGAPRAVWYGLEFIRWALRRLWLGERGEAYLRGYSVSAVFEQHVRNMSDGTKKKLRYYTRYIPPEGLPRMQLYGVYAATTNDGDKEMYAALLRSCEAGGSGSRSSNGIASSKSGSSTDSSAGISIIRSTDSSASSSSTSSRDVTELAAAWPAAEVAAGPALLQPEQREQQAAVHGAQQEQQAGGRVAQQVAAMLAAAAAPLCQLSTEQQQALLHGPDIHAATETLLGMRIFLGGVSHPQFHAWADRTGFIPPGGDAGGRRGGSFVEL